MQFDFSQGIHLFSRETPKEPLQRIQIYVFVGQLKHSGSEHGKHSPSTKA